MTDDKRMEISEELRRAVEVMKMIVDRGILMHEDNQRLSRIQVYHDQALIAGPRWFKQPETVVEYKDVTGCENILRWGIISRALEVLEQNNYGEDVRTLEYNPHCGTIDIL